MNPNEEDSSLISDAPTISDDHENTIESMQTKIDRLKQLMVKAKHTISSYMQRTDQLEKEIENSHLKQVQLENSLSKLEKLKLPKQQEIDKVIARATIGNDTYALVTAKDKTCWVNEREYSFKAPLPEPLDEACAPSEQAKQIAEVISQYEDRLKRMQDTLESHEQKHSALQLSYKSLQSEHSEVISELDSRPLGATLNLVSESAEIYDSLMELVFQSDEATMSALSMQKQISLFANKPAEGELQRAREHLASLLRSLVDISKRLIHSRNEMSAQEKAWRTKCDELTHEKGKLDSEITRVRTELGKNQEDYNNTLHQLESQQQGELVEAFTRVHYLEGEIKKQVNLPYLKNVVLQYITANEEDVQDRLINVLGTLLGFSSYELEKVQGARTYKGVFTRLLSWSS